MDNNLEKTEHIFKRVVNILEQARNNTVLAVNSNMVKAYWLIGREIVLEIQDGKSRAAYGKELINSLSNQLSRKYGKGFSETNLQLFRKFYLTYPTRYEIQYPVGTELQKQYPLGSEFTGFAPQLS